MVIMRIALEMTDYRIISRHEAQAVVMNVETYFEFAFITTRCATMG